MQNHDDIFGFTTQYVWKQLKSAWEAEAAVASSPEISEKWETPEAVGMLLE